MDAKTILQSSVLDILFEHRNKSYGAYSLRYSYNKRMHISILVTICIVLSFVLFSLCIHKKVKAVHNTLYVNEVKIQNYTNPKQPKKIVPPATSAAPKVEMKKLTIPKIVVDEDVKLEELPPKQTECITIGPVTQHGIKLEGGLAAPTEIRGIGGKGKGLGGNDSGIGNRSDKEFYSVQVKASYPGGDAAWQKYLHRNLQSNIPTDNGAPLGKIRIVVSFLVSRNGSISEVETIAAPNPDYGAAAEAMRVISQSGKWNPAIQNGSQVTFRQTQAVVFDVVQ